MVMTGFIQCRKNAFIKNAPGIFLQLLIIKTELCQKSTKKFWTTSLRLSGMCWVQDNFSKFKISDCFNWNLIQLYKQSLSILLLHIIAINKKKLSSFFSIFLEWHIFLYLSYCCILKEILFIACLKSYKSDKFNHMPTGHKVQYNIFLL